MRIRFGFSRKNVAVVCDLLPFAWDSVTTVPPRVFSAL